MPLTPGDIPSRAVSAVIATKDRAPLVTAKVGWLLRRPEVGEVIVVADGCTDDTAECLRAVGDDRIVLIEHDRPHGPSKARMAGVARASLPWVALLDDDDLHPDDFLVRLWEVACASEADIVGAPWFQVPTDADVTAEVARRRLCAAPPALDDVGRFPPGRWAETPLLPMNVLVRAAVFRDVTYDGGYLVNFWREESDFFISAHTAGHRVVLTSTTFSWLPGRSSGGIPKGARLRYEWWAARNNWRFLQRHGRALQDLGVVGGLHAAQASFVVQRCQKLARGTLMARVGRIRKARGQ